VEEEEGHRSDCRECRGARDEREASSR
jgi:hypothetical protein